VIEDLLEAANPSSVTKIERQDMSKPITSSIIEELKELKVTMIKKGQE
jgi:hypothetical protein